MPKIKYVGLKKGPIGETAFAHETNITWFPGTVKSVPQAIAARMLNHPDVFALAADDAAEDDGDASAPQAEPVQAAVPQRQEDHGGDGEDAKLTPQQQRMAQFAAGDTGNENEMALGAGEATPTPAEAQTDAPAAAATLAPGGTIAPAPAAAKPAGKAKGK